MITVPASALAETLKLSLEAGGYLSCLLSRWQASVKGVFGDGEKYFFRRKVVQGARKFFLQNCLKKNGHVPSLGKKRLV